MRFSPVVIVAILLAAASWCGQGLVRAQGVGKAFQDVNVELTLGPGDPTDPMRRTFFKTHKIYLVAGATYCIDLKDADAKPLPKVLPGVKVLPEQLCDPYLKLKDPIGREVAFDDDSGGRLDARILYKAKETGVHEIVATTYQPGQTGRFTLTIRVAKPAHWMELWNARAISAPRASRPDLQHLFDDFRAAIDEKGKTIKFVELRPLQGFAYALEPTAKDLAKEAHRLLANAADQAADAGVAQFAGVFRNAHKRLSSVGREIELRGTTADGQAFDLKELRGKHVLLCFSIRSDPSNVVNVSSMNLLHGAYKDRGFEIVEITAHPDRQALTAQLQKLQPPWKVLLDEKPPKKAIGPLFEKFGVAFVPAYILIDKDQRVAGLASLQPERD